MCFKNILFACSSSYVGKGAQSASSRVLVLSPIHGEGVGLCCVVSELVSLCGLEESLTEPEEALHCVSDN